jgi:hypothetical protein
LKVYKLLVLWYETNLYPQSLTLISSRRQKVVCLFPIGVYLLHFTFQKGNQEFRTKAQKAYLTH